MRGPLLAFCLASTRNLQQSRKQKWQRQLLPECLEDWSPNAWQDLHAGASCRFRRFDWQSITSICLCRKENAASFALIQMPQEGACVEENIVSPVSLVPTSQGLRRRVCRIPRFDWQEPQKAIYRKNATCFPFALTHKKYHTLGSM